MGADFAKSTDLRITSSAEPDKSASKKSSQPDFCTKKRIARKQNRQITEIEQDVNLHKNSTDFLGKYLIKYIDLQTERKHKTSTSEHQAKNCCINET